MHFWPYFVSLWPWPLTFWSQNLTSSPLSTTAPNWSVGCRTGTSEGLNKRCCTLFSSFFYQYTALSICAVDGHQMYSGGSVVREASIIVSEISTTPPLIFTEGQKVRNWALFSTSLDFKLSTFEECSEIYESWNKLVKHQWSPYSLPKFSEVWSTHPWEPSRESVQPPKIVWQKYTKSSITRPRIISCCSNSVQSLNT